MATGVVSAATVVAGADTVAVAVAVAVTKVAIRVTTAWGALPRRAPVAAYVVAPVVPSTAGSPLSMVISLTTRQSIHVSACAAWAAAALGVVAMGEAVPLRVVTAPIVVPCVTAGHTDNL